MTELPRRGEENSRIFRRVVDGLGPTGRPEFGCVVVSAHSMLAKWCLLMNALKGSDRYGRRAMDSRWVLPVANVTAALDELRDHGIAPLSHRVYGGTE